MSAIYTVIDDIIESDRDVTTYTAIDDIVESDKDVTTYTAIDDIVDGHQLVLVLGFLLTFGI